MYWVLILAFSTSPPFPGQFPMTQRGTLSKLQSTLAPQNSPPLQMSVMMQLGSVHVGDEIILPWQLDPKHLALL